MRLGRGTAAAVSPRRSAGTEVVIYCRAPGGGVREGALSGPALPPGRLVFCGQQLVDTVTDPVMPNENVLSKIPGEGFRRGWL